MRDNNKFDYHYSKILDQEYAVNKTTGMVHFFDGTKYKKAEYNIMIDDKMMPDIIKNIHFLKSVFKGELIK